MKIDIFAISGPLLITPKLVIEPERGIFAEIFRETALLDRIGGLRFVQDNHSLSIHKGTIRGLHFQADPHAQGKLVRCSRGAIFDVAVDIRRESPTFGQHVSAELTDQNWHQLWVPPGFLHGFCTLTDNVEVQYKVTSYYHPAADRAVQFDDPALGIAWPVTRAQATLSEKDANAPELRHL